MNKFGANLINDFSQYEELSKKYNIPVSEILQMDMNRCGVYIVSNEIREDFRVRFKATFDGDYMSWYALPVRAKEDTNFIVDGDKLYYKDKVIANLNTELFLDTCENSYQRGPTLLNLNSRSRSNCGGCKACIHNYKSFYDETVIKDLKQLKTKEDLEEFFDLRPNIDVAKLDQIAVVTGLFGSEANVVSHMKLVSEVAKARGFNGELMYFGCEVNSDEALEELAKLGNFYLIYALDNFTNREMILSSKKAKIDLEFAKDTLTRAKAKGIKTTIAYIDGIDKFEKIVDGFNYLKDAITEFPIVNIYQIQTPGQAEIMNDEARDIEYYLDSRVEIEKVFKDTGLRPKRWSNYRPLWYKYFDGEELPDNAFGQLGRNI